MQCPVPHYELLRQGAAEEALGVDVGSAGISGTDASDEDGQDDKRFHSISSMAVLPNGARMPQTLKVTEHFQKAVSHAENANASYNCRGPIRFFGVHDISLA